MTDILIARHGETEWSFRGKLQGVAPVPLNEHGKNQSEMLARAIKHEYGRIDAVYASPVNRARQTAEIVYEALDGETDLVFEDAIEAQHYGEYQGLKLGHVFTLWPEFDLNKNGRGVIEAEPERGESIRSTEERVLEWWEKMKMVAAHEDGPFLVITHGIPLEVMMADATDEDLYEIMLEYEHEPIETAKVSVDGDGNVIDAEPPEPPLGLL